MVSSKIIACEPSLNTRRPSHERITSASHTLLFYSRLRRAYVRVWRVLRAYRRAKPSILSLKRLACEPGLVKKQLLRGPANYLYSLRQFTPPAIFEMKGSIF